MTKFVAGFPGVGKSYLYNIYEEEDTKTVVDSDSSKFSWIYNEDGSKERNPNFIEDYKYHLEEQERNNVDYVLVSTHEDVLNMISASFDDYVVIYPDLSMKDEFLARYRKRGSELGFIDMMDKNFDSFVKSIERNPYLDDDKLIRLDETMSTVQDVLSKNLI